MIVYIALLGIIISLGVVHYSGNEFTIIGLKERNINGSLIVFLLAFLMVAFVEAMRSPVVGEDLEGYITWFEHYRAIPFGIKTLLDFSSFEPGFILLYKAVGLVSSSGRAFIIVSSILIVFLHFFFLYKNSDDFYLSVLLFFGFNHFFTSMVSLRQYLAMGIVFWVLPSLRKGKILRAVLLSIASFFFHQSTIVAVVFFVVAVSIILFAQRVFLFFIQFFPKYESFYAIGKSGALGQLRLVYILLEIALIIFVYFCNDTDDQEELSEYSFLLIPSIICGLVTFIPWLFRLGYYFDYFLLLLVPKIVSKAEGNKTVLRLAVALISVVFFAYYLSVNPGETVPYVFY